MVEWKRQFDVRRSKSRWTIPPYQVCIYLGPTTLEGHTWMMLPWCDTTPHRKRGTWLWDNMLTREKIGYFQILFHDILYLTRKKNNISQGRETPSNRGNQITTVGGNIKAKPRNAEVFCTDKTSTVSSYDHPCRNPETNIPTYNRNPLKPDICQNPTRRKAAKQILSAKNKTKM